MHSSRYRSNKNPFEFFCHGLLSFFTNNKPHGESKLTGYSLLIKVRSLRNMRLCFTLQMIICFFFQSIQNLWYSKQPVPAVQDISTPDCIFVLENKSFLQIRHTPAFRSRCVTSLSHFALFYNKRSQSVNIYILTEMVALLQTCSNMERSTVS